MKPKSETKPKTPRKAKEPTPSLEHFELLISDEYELTRPIPIEVTRYDDGVVLIASRELNLYAEADDEYQALRDFSFVLTEHLEDLVGFLKEGKKLGRDLEIRLSMLRRLLRRIK